MQDESDESFMGRWSRRKRLEAETVDQADPQTPENISDGELVDDAVDAEISEERQLELDTNRAAAEAVDLEAIEYESDLSVFYKEGVPAFLKHAAMQKMWRTNPIFANVDGLNDYDQDFNVIDKVLKEFKSAWQVGRGYAPLVKETDDKDDVNEQEAVEDEAQVAAIDEDEPTDGNTEAPDTADESASDEQDQSSQTIEATVPEDAPPVSGVTMASESQGQTQSPNIDDTPVTGEDARPKVSLRRRMAQFSQD